MIVAIDTNVLLDILVPGATHAELSLNALMSLRSEDELIICGVVFAELGSQFLSYQDLDRFIRDTGIQLVPENRQSLFEASNAWKHYAKHKKRVIVCPSCGKHQELTCVSCKGSIPYRQHVLADFLIGAHAKTQADKLITRDRGFYRAYFRDLNIMTP